MKRDNLLNQLQDAYERLAEAAKMEPTHDIIVDGTIQRFEFTFELTWKTLKAFLEDQGILCYSPKTCLREAYRMGWIDDESSWLSLQKARNLTSHVYNQIMAREIYNEVVASHEIIAALISTLKTL